MAIETCRYCGGALSGTALGRTHGQCPDEHEQRVAASLARCRRATLDGHVTSIYRPLDGPTMYVARTRGHGAGEVLGVYPTQEAALEAVRAAKPEMAEC